MGEYGRKSGARTLGREYIFRKKLFEPAPPGDK